MSFREMFTPKLQLKLLSLLLAGLLWLFVNLETKDVAAIPLTLSFANLPAGFKVRQVDPQQLSINAAGPRILLLRQRLKGVSISLDISNVGAGKRTFSELEGSAIPVSGVRFIKVSPVVIDVYPATSIPIGSPNIK